MGRAYLAFCSAGERDRLIARLRADPARGFDEAEERRFRALLDRIRRDGFAMRDPRTKPYRTTTLAVPIREDAIVHALMSDQLLHHRGTARRDRRAHHRAPVRNAGEDRGGPAADGRQQRRARPGAGRSSSRVSEPAEPSLRLELRVGRRRAALEQRIEPAQGQQPALRAHAPAGRSCRRSGSADGSAAPACRRPRRASGTSGTAPCRGRHRTSPGS